MMKDILLGGLILYAGIEIGRGAQKAWGGKRGMGECPRPQSLNEAMRGLERHTRAFPVIAQNQLFYRNLIENPYDY